jgi:protein-S-isoprenylcysteine O-methyltransferase Ste14
VGATLLQALAFAAPAVLAGALWAARRPDARRRAGMLLACAWVLAALPPVNALAVHLGWWRFAGAEGAFFGIPAGFLAGWVALWGLLPALAAPRLAAWLDVLLMPRLAPALELGPGWLAGEAVALTLVFLPARLLAEWTADDRRLGARAALQVAAAGVLALVILPEAVGAAVAAAPGVPALRTAPPVSLAVALQLVAVPALLGVAAVHEFARRGGGTPIPFDAPRRLVRSGPYAYVANPMQLSMAATLAAWAVLTGAGWLLAAAAMSVVYAAGLAAWDEGEDLRARFGGRWDAYRAAVRAWLPRWRPWHPSLDGGEEPARLYVSAGCGTCSEMGLAVMALQPVGLVVVPAEEHPERDLSRITYDPRDGGPEDEGVAALARALEHVNLACAVLGMAMRLPVIRPLLQVVVDASGGGPMLVRRGAPAPCEVRT